MKNESVNATSPMYEMGELIETYRNHIKAAYDLSKKMEENGIERPWVVVIENRKASECDTVVCRNDSIVDYDVEQKIRIRLEIR